MTKSAAQVFIGQGITKAQGAFYGGKTVTGGSGLKILAHIELQETGGVNGNLFPYGDDGMCVLVGAAVLELGIIGTKFVLAHELGHAFVVQVCSNMGMDPERDITGKKEEVLPDVIAAFILSELGVSFTDVAEMLMGVEGEMVFDADNSGHHPAHHERLQCILEFSSMVGQSDFATAARYVLTHVLQE